MQPPFAWQRQYDIAHQGSSASSAVARMPEGKTQVFLPFSVKQMLLESTVYKRGYGYRKSHWSNNRSMCSM